MPDQPSVFVRNTVDRPYIQGNLMCLWAGCAPLPYAALMGPYSEILILWVIAGIQLLVVLLLVLLPGLWTRLGGLVLAIPPALITLGLYNGAVNVDHAVLGGALMAAPLVFYILPRMFWKMAKDALARAESRAS